MCHLWVPIFSHVPSPLPSISSPVSRYEVPAQLHVPLFAPGAPTAVNVPRTGPVRPSPFADPSKLPCTVPAAEYVNDVDLSENSPSCFPTAIWCSSFG